MAKLPFMPFFPSDYLRDTRCLSLAARGAWMDLLCTLWHAPKRGQRTLSLTGWAGEIGKSVDEVAPLLEELISAEVGEISRENDGKITVISRRMVRDERSRKQARKRKQKQRVGDESRTLSRDCPAPVTGIYQKSEVRSHISEVIQDKEKKEKKRESAPAPTGGTVLESLEQFRLTPELEAWAVKEGIEDPGRYVEEFKDYWRSVGGRRKSGQPVKDWAAAFRNRLRQLKAMGKLLAVSDTLEERLRKWADEAEVSA